jgi:hypothetical protein
MKHVHKLFKEVFDDLRKRLRDGLSKYNCEDKLNAGDSIEFKRMADDEYHSSSFICDVIHENLGDYAIRLRPTAQWDLSLMAECPNCQHEWDLVNDEPDFFDGRKLEICETGTDNSEGIELTCSKCEFEFKIDLRY